MLHLPSSLPVTPRQQHTGFWQKVCSWGNRAIITTFQHSAVQETCVRPLCVPLYLYLTTYKMKFLKKWSAVVKNVRSPWLNPAAVSLFTPLLREKVEKIVFCVNLIQQSFLSLFCTILKCQGWMKTSGQLLSQFKTVQVCCDCKCISAVKRWKLQTMAIFYFKYFTLQNQKSLEGLISSQSTDELQSREFPSSEAKI